MIKIDNKLIFTIKALHIYELHKCAVIFIQEVAGFFPYVMKLLVTGEIIPVEAPPGGKY